MPMDSVTLENAEHIMQERDICEKELATLRGTSLETIWLTELDSLEREYTGYKTRRAQIQAGGAQSTKTIKKAGGGGRKK